MADVRALQDARLGREVAIKTVRTEGEMGRRRFLREVQVQGQLEHPSIVPVYDLGTGEDGRPYFTMKRVRGLTLGQVLRELNGPGARDLARFTHRRLLSDFLTVCQAIEFAHTRGVVHRDLKPANVMLGEFGEVYVLDWGIAKLIAHEETDEELSMKALTDTPSIPPPPGIATRQGVMIGTPGYMAPEQIQDARSADQRTDIYALGAILFGILTLEALHPGPTDEEALRSTLEGPPNLAERLRARQVPPELQAICLKATATNPDDRYSTVHELIADIERYLDGDRDLAQRRSLAGAHLAKAEAALTASQDHASRGEAIREAGRALVLLPDDTKAQDMVARLLLEPPSSVPAAVIEEEQALAAKDEARHSRYGAFGHLMWLVLTVLGVIWGGERVQFLVLHVVSLGVIVVWMGLRSTRQSSSPLALLAIIALSMTTIVSACRLFGPFVVIPSMASTGTFMFLHHPAAQRAGPKWVILLGCAAVLVPVLLEVSGALPPTYFFEDGVRIMLPNLAGVGKTASLLFITVMSMFMVIAPGVTIANSGRAIEAARRKILLNAWQLGRLVSKDGAQG